MGNTNVRTIITIEKKPAVTFIPYKIRKDKRC